MAQRLRKVSERVSQLIFWMCCFNSVVLAAPGHFYVGGAVDESVARLGNNNPVISYFSGIGVTDSYPPTQVLHPAILFSVNGGYEFAGGNGWPATAFGLAVFRTINDYNVNGQVTETIQGILDDGAGGTTPSNVNDLYTYAYNIKQWIAMAELKFTWQLWHFSPYFNLGVGPSWNELTNYHETAIDNSGFAALQPFQANTTVNVAYQLGFGIGYDFNFNGENSIFKHERVALGYRYMGFGDISFGTRNADYPYKLNPGRLMANTVYLSFEHLF